MVFELNWSIPETKSRKNLIESEYFRTNGEFERFHFVQHKTISSLIAPIKPSCTVRFGDASLIRLLFRVCVCCNSLCNFSLEPDCIN